MLFVYGTLQDADMLGAVLGRPMDIAGLRAALAPGYRAVAYPGQTYPALVRSESDTAPGLLLEELSDFDLAVLDAFEGEQYCRAAITVLAAGASRRAEAYRPVMAISADAPIWSLVDWTARHKSLVLDQEAGLASALRRSLAAGAPH